MGAPTRLTKFRCVPRDIGGTVYNLLSVENGCSTTASAIRTVVNDFTGPNNALDERITCTLAVAVADHLGPHHVTVGVANHLGTISQQVTEHRNSDIRTRATASPVSPATLPPNALNPTPNPPTSQTPIYRPMRRPARRPRRRDRPGDQAAADHVSTDQPAVLHA